MAGRRMRRFQGALLSAGGDPLLVSAVVAGGLLLVMLVWLLITMRFPDS